MLFMVMDTKRVVIYPPRFTTIQRAKNWVNKNTPREDFFNIEIVREDYFVGFGDKEKGK
jgi:hypothetical protein